MAEHTFTLDEEGLGQEKGPHVYASRELLDEVLKVVPKEGDVVYLTVVIGEGKSRSVRLFMGKGVRFVTTVINKSREIIRANVEHEPSS
jgi:hypothetical protein